MPTTEQILEGLTSTADAWRVAAVLWHAYFGALVIAWIAGARPSRRTAGILLALPILSVSAIAWISRNPFNGSVFALIGIPLIAVSAGFPGERSRVAPPWAAIPGILLFIFGWAYPHFLGSSSPWSALYAAPTGIIPCPTLSIVIGLALVLDGLGSRALMLFLGIPGMFYGVTGVAQLGVAIDWALLLGSGLILVRALVSKSRRGARCGKDEQRVET